MFSFLSGGGAGAMWARLGTVLPYQLGLCVGPRGGQPESLGRTAAPSSARPRSRRRSGPGCRVRLPTRSSAARSWRPRRGRTSRRSSRRRSAPGAFATCRGIRELGVTTAWDLGISDAMAIVFAQTTGIEVRIIDYLRGHGPGPRLLRKAPREEILSLHGTQLAPRRRAAGARERVRRGGLRGFYGTAPSARQTSCDEARVLTTRLRRCARR